MEAEILQELESIRVYLFILMCGLTLFIFFKILESVQRIQIGFQDSVNKSFENRMQKLLNKGNYDEVIKECKGVLENYPNDVDAIWYQAKAYYMKGDNEVAKELFERVIYLLPGWESSAKPYLENMNE